MIKKSYLHKLKPKQREVPPTYHKGCKIFDRDNDTFLTHKQVAAILGCTPDTVGHRMSRYAKRGVPVIDIADLKQLTESRFSRTKSDMPRQGRSPNPPRETWKPNDIYAQRTSTPFSIRFTKPQHQKLDALRDKTGLNVAEIVRRAIDEYLEKHP